jgi:hypothetical protein
MREPDKTPKMLGFAIILPNRQLTLTEMEI